MEDGFIEFHKSTVLTIESVSKKKSVVLNRDSSLTNSFDQSIENKGLKFNMEQRRYFS